MWDGYDGAQRGYANKWFVDVERMPWHKVWKQIIITRLLYKEDPGSGCEIFQKSGKEL